METQEKAQNCSFCKGGSCCGANSTHAKCKAVRIILTIAILFVVFIGGVKLGELKGMLYGRGCGFEHDHFNGQFNYQNHRRAFSNNIIKQVPKEELQNIEKQGVTIQNKQ